MDPRRLPDSVRNAIVAGMILGVVAACVVWFLERFEVARMHEQIREHLERHDAFGDFLRQREDGEQ